MSLFINKTIDIRCITLSVSISAHVNTPFTLPDNEIGTDTVTDEIGTEHNRYRVLMSVSVQYEHFHVILYETIFVSLNISYRWLNDRKSDVQVTCESSFQGGEALQ